MNDASASQPDVLFIIAHDIGPLYGCYGGPAITPHVDRLARRSYRFDRHYCQYPLCGPSRASLFSGCRPLTTRRFDNTPFFPEFRKKMGPAFRTLPEHFRQNGYRTVGSGFIFHDVDDEPSWSEPIRRPPLLSPAAERHPDIPEALVTGWINQWLSDASFDLIRSRWKRLQFAGYTEADLSDPVIARKAKGPAVEAADVDDEAYIDGKTAASAAEHIEQCPDETPLFLAAGFVCGHLPFLAPKRYWDNYDSSALHLPAIRHTPSGTTEWARGDSEPAQYYTTDGYEKPWSATAEQSRELLHGHLAAMTYTDALVGRMLSALEARGRLERTIIVFTSDHGYSDGHHGYWGKHNSWDRSLWTPLLISPPAGLSANAEESGLNAGQRAVPAVTEHVDLFPTLCDFCAIEQPPFLEGSSMRAVMNGGSFPAGPSGGGSTRAAPQQGSGASGAEALRTPGGKPAIAHRKHMWHDRLQVYAICNSVRTGRYRYTEYLDEQGGCIHTELFDYEADPEESANLAGDQRYANAARALRNFLRAAVGSQARVPDRPPMSPDGAFIVDSSEQGHV